MNRHDDQQVSTHTTACLSVCQTGTRRAVQQGIGQCKAVLTHKAHIEQAYGLTEMNLYCCSFSNMEQSFGTSVLVLHIQKQSGVAKKPTSPFTISEGVSAEMNCFVVYNCE